ncbi:hypothetical protein PR202_ga23661 [Eleusine coracana subsp. coracana]|uniref:Uncharacterized protein n=1 Tax=Eleusine coracana subsp. coracana TaxID=191504 RepID=A0AAV5D7F6_ELECO|nr:hypothetical protein QOZ80_1AG0007700 [Eleusine coracana subsp. coracana]GJN05980.1 hypothetical protein PR202_ga23661 [Eleusine coracana subsp. coracana]
MQQLTACCKFASILGPKPASCWSRQRPSLTMTTAASTTKKKRAAAIVACAASRRDDGSEFSCGDGDGGRLVDEGMVALRRRIDEIRAAECAAWEEEEWYVASANADVCYLIGALQALLLSERPGVGVELVAALALAVPASAFVLVSHLLLDASRGILSNLPH